MDVLVPVSQFIKIPEEGDESLSPICEPHWLSIGLGH